MGDNLEAAKLRIIGRLIAAQDEILVNLIEQLLDSEKDLWDELSDLQKAKIEGAIEQHEAGNSTPHHEFMKELRSRFAK